MIANIDNIENDEYNGIDSSWDFLNKNTPCGIFISASQEDIFLVSEAFGKKFALILASEQSTELIALKLNKKTISFGRFYKNFDIKLHYSGDRDCGFGLLNIDEGKIEIYCRLLDGARIYLPVGITKPDLYEKHGKFMRWTISFGDCSHDFGFIRRDDSNFTSDENICVFDEDVNPVLISIHD